MSELKSHGVKAFCEKVAEAHHFVSELTPSHGVKALCGKVAEAHHFVLELTPSHGVKAFCGKVAEAHHFVLELTPRKRHKWSAETRQTSSLSCLLNEKSMITKLIQHRGLSQRRYETFYSCKRNLNHAKTNVKNTPNDILRVRNGRGVWYSNYLNI